jgi:hypothetical protein
MARIPGSDGFFLYKVNSSQPVLSFRTGYSNQPLVASMSNDARFLAFARADGTVALCELDTVRKRLNELGLGW